jgi:Putative adhesin
MKHATLVRFLSLAALAWLPSGLRADETTSEIKFSDPAKPGTLKISIGHGNLQVRGVDAKAVTVKSDTEATSPAPRKDGMRELASASSFSLSEKGNLITLDAAADGPRGSSDFNLTVPRSTSLIVSNAWGGDISCSDVSGDIEIKNMNGRIKIDGIAGGVLVETMNGDVSADVRELREGKPLSFTSMNGEILIRVPSETKANVRLRSQNGSIWTDFDEKALVTKTESFGKVRPSARPSADAKSRKRSNDSEMHEEIHTAVTEAVRVSVDAVQEATAAIREATMAAKAEVDAAWAGDRDGSPMPPRPPLPPMTGGKIVTGTLNQGGPEIQAASMNGDVTLRKLDGKK